MNDEPGYFVIIASEHSNSSLEEFIGVYDEAHILSAYKDTKKKLFNMCITFRPCYLNALYTWGDK